MSAIVGPIAPYSNVPINAQYYQPSKFFISDIILGQTTTITTTEDNNYVIGQVCRLIIPPSSGCRQLNEVQGVVIDIVSSDEVVLNIDSSQNVDPFTASSAATQPQITAIGDVNSGQINTNGNQMIVTYIPGSFIDISPN